MSELKSPLLVWMPKFSIDNKRNIYASFKTQWVNSFPESKIAVFDYWTITDRKGTEIKLEPNEIITSKQCKNFSLLAKNALSKLTFEELTVSFHFLITVGQNTGYSVVVNYFTDSQFKSFKIVPTETKEITEDEITRFFEIIGKYQPKPPTLPKPQMPPTLPAPPEPTGYTPELDEYIKVVYREMYFLKEAGGKEYKVTNGRFLKRTLSSYVYCFDLEAELFLADDSPLTLKIGLRKINGTVSFCENFLIIIALEEAIDSDTNLVIPNAYISSEPWKLLESINKCLYQIDEQSKVALMLMNEGPKLSSNGPLSEIKRGQTEAVNHALEEPITVIWGPPGTGKTYTMANLAGEYVKQGKSVLIVSHSNISVDNVVKQIYSQFTKTDLNDSIMNNKVLRYGYVRDEELQKNPDVVSFNVVIGNSSYKEKYDKLIEEKNRLLREQEFNHGTEIAKKIDENEKQLKEIRSIFKDREKELVAAASVVATTVSKIYSDSLFFRKITPFIDEEPIYEKKMYDVVMFDEVSMAYVPQIICAASFARSNLICVGDFRQLAPIVHTKGLLEKDIFEYLGICSGFTNIHPHPWLFMLDEQRRMHPDISRFPSRYVYHGLLRNHTSVQEKWKKNVLGEPFQSSSMTLIDLYTTCCAASKNEDNSRFNILSAVVSLGTALKAEKAQLEHREFTPEEKTGIITPYAAQTRLIRAMIEDYRKSYKTAISCATVHQFQGSERNTIIFDAVESYPSPKAGWLMSKNEGGAVTRLINVAITRARGKFITITNKVFWENHFEANNMYYALVRHMKENSNVVGFKDNLFSEYFNTLECGEKIQIFSECCKCENRIVEEISKARKEIVLLLPQGNYNQEFGKNILDAMRRRSLGGISVSICRDKNAIIPAEYEQLCLLSEKVTMPLLFIDNVIWYGVPILQYSYTDKNTTYNAVTSTIIRFSGSNTVEMIRSLVDRSGSKKTFTGGFALYVKNNSKCSCGGSYKLAKGPKGFLLKCAECGKTMSLSEQLINSYMDIAATGKCPSCGKDAYAKIGPYGWYVTCMNGHNRNLNDI